MKGKIIRINLIVDGIIGFLEEGPLFSPRTRIIIPHIDEYLKKEWTEERRHNQETIFVGDAHGKNDLENKIFGVHCQKGSKEAQIIQELRWCAENSYSSVYTKKSHSALFETGLLDHLQAYHPFNAPVPENMEIVIMGAWTDVCVLHTIIDLVRYGYNKIIVSKDCVETGDLPWHPGDEVQKWALVYIEKVLGAKVVDHLD
ncbi:MAG: cysteine hydrolase [Patescibacteria group bacterium]|nr:cysteine hydrolase [Patescibacteria group bacterium]MDD5534666.1 cysteine hydrolase [Patescibacteria group bacterium]